MDLTPKSPPLEEEDTLNRLRAACTESWQEPFLNGLAIDAGVIWECPECNSNNPEAEDTCAYCALSSTPSDSDQPLNPFELYSDYPQLREASLMLKHKIEGLSLLPARELGPVYPDSIHPAVEKAISEVAAVHNGRLSGVEDTEPRDHAGIYLAHLVGAKLAGEYKVLIQLIEALEEETREPRTHTSDKSSVEDNPYDHLYPYLCHYCQHKEAENSFLLVSYTFALGVFGAYPNGMIDADHYLDEKFREEEAQFHLVCQLCGTSRKISPQTVHIGEDRLELSTQSPLTLGHRTKSLVTI